MIETRTNDRDFRCLEGILRYFQIDVNLEQVATEDIELVFLKVSRSLDAQLTRTLLRRLENTVVVMTTDTIRRNRNYLEKDVQMMKNMLQALTVHTDTVAPASDDNGNHPDSSMDTLSAPLTGLLLNI